MLLKARMAVKSVIAHEGRFDRCQAEYEIAKPETLVALPRSKMRLPTVEVRFRLLKSQIS